VNVLKRNEGEMEVLGLDSELSFGEEGAKVEEAGKLFCPLLGAMITSGAHLLLAFLDNVTAKLGGEVVYQDTDSAFVTPSTLAPEVARAFDPLNPYSVTVPFLKDETPAHSGAVSFFGLSSKRYALFERDRHGRVRVLKGSDHGLGMYQVPSDREEFTKRVWERLIGAAIDGEEDFSDFAYLPATAQFSLTTPALWPRVSHVEGMRPFNFLTIRYLDPAAIPEGAETFQLLPFHSPKEPAWLALGEKDGAKTWAHILEAFSRHRDRKHLLDKTTGRILRRTVLVKKSSLVGLGKEGTKLGARLKLGKIAGGNPAVYVDWKRRLLAMGRAEARLAGLSWDSVKRAKRTLRRTGTLRDGHGGRFLSRLKAALLAGGV
jgi:hypothetical protein